MVKTWQRLRGSRKAARSTVAQGDTTDGATPDVEPWRRDAVEEMMTMHFGRETKMTVADLVAALQALPDQTIPVWADGCSQCANPVDAVGVEEGIAWLGVVL